MIVEIVDFERSVPFTTPKRKKERKKEKKKCVRAGFIENFLTFSRFLGDSARAASK